MTGAIDRKSALEAIKQGSREDEDSGKKIELHDMEWIVGLIDARAPEPAPRGPYKKRATA